MGYHKRGSPHYVVIRKQGIQPVRAVRHSLSRKKTQKEADFLTVGLETERISDLMCVWRAGTENTGTHDFLQRTLWR